MLILGIETSCDETAASLVKGNNEQATLVSNAVASSLVLHAKTGGIIPETAAREQIKYIIPVIKEALGKIDLKDIDAIAVTEGPGLIGSLLVGVETAKTLAYALKKPIMPVNHLLGHIYANFIKIKLDADIDFPAIALIVSGGHTDLLFIKKHGDFKWLGGTRDDAAGEAFDKIGRLLNLPYPGGPEIAKKADEFKVDSSFKTTLPRPLINSNDFDFSFSGLKTAAFREIDKLKKSNKLNTLTIQRLSYETEQAIVDILVTKTLKAIRQYKPKSILLGGGVASNQKLRSQLKLRIKESGFETPLFVPEKSLCTDNAAMIASFAYFNPYYKPWQEITADPDLHF